MSDRLLARLILPARAESLRLASALVRTLGHALGLAERGVDHLETAVDEACTNVIQHAFDPGEGGTFELRARIHLGRLGVDVEDQGLPFNQSAVDSGIGAGLGMKLMRAMAREVRLVNLGAGGKRTELWFDLPSTMMETLMAEPPAPSGEVAPSEASVRLRWLSPCEAPALARCIYRTYGYSYISEALYRPEQVQARMEAGLVESLVAETPDGELAAHLGLLREHAGARIAESGQAVVAPAFRGRHLFEQMKAVLVEHAREAGLLALTSEAVTLHPATQKANEALGAIETGLLLGYIPGSLKFGNMAQDGLRQSAMLYCLPLHPAPRRTVWLPFHHRGHLMAIYERLGLARDFPAGQGPGPEVHARRERHAPPEEAETRRGPSRASAPALVDLTVRPEWGQALLRVRRWGPDLADQVQAQKRALCLQGLACIYLDLPLAQAPAARACPALEALGFSFAGLLPESLEDGDALRLQYLNNVAVDPDRILAATPFGTRMKEYVLQGMAL